MAWSDEQDTMLEQIEETFAVPISLISVTIGAYNPATGKRTETSTESQTVNADRSDVRVESRSAGGSMRQMEVRTYEIRKAQITLASPEPLRGWRINDGNEIFEVVNVRWDCDRRNFILTAERARS